LIQVCIQESNLAVEEGGGRTSLVAEAGDHALGKKGVSVGVGGPAGLSQQVPVASKEHVRLGDQHVPSKVLGRCSSELTDSRKRQVESDVTIEPLGGWAKRVGFLTPHQGDFRSLWRGEKGGRP
jgi:hypothetical protein